MSLPRKEMKLQPHFHSFPALSYQFNNSLTSHLHPVYSVFMSMNKIYRYRIYFPTEYMMQMILRQEKKIKNHLQPQRCSLYIRLVLKLKASEIN